MVEFALDGGAPIPSKKNIGSFSGELAGEGQKVTLSDGETVTWAPPITKSPVPDLSNVKSVKHYFNRVGFSPYPAWIYHPAEDARIVKHQEEALEYGVFYRETTHDERMRGMQNATWDWIPDTKWRPKPYPKLRVYDPSKPEGGKAYEPPRPDYQQAQHDMLKAMVDGLAALSKGNGGSGSISPETLANAFAMAMQKAGPPAPEPSKMTDAEFDALSAKAKEAEAIADHAERDLWLAEAERLELKVDKRWGLERLKTEVEKANASE